MAIRENKTGSFTAIWYVNRRPKEKTFSTRRLAEDFLDHIRLKKERDEVYGSRANDVKISDLMQQYLQEVRKAPKTKINTIAALNRWEAWFDQKKIRKVYDLNKAVIREYENYRASDNIRKKNNGKTSLQPITQRTVNIDIRTMIALLNHAWRYDRIDFNPIAKYPLSPEKKKFDRYLSLSEIKKILEKSREFGLYDIIYAFLTLGLRSEEACFLRHSDAKDGHIYLGSKKVWRTNHGTKETLSWTPKWGKERWVYYDENYANDHYLKNLFEQKKNGYVFPHAQYSDGRPWRPDVLRTKFKKACVDARIDRPDEITIHSLRHTHISYAVARVGKDPNISIPLIMENVGHRDLKTLQGYMKAVKSLAKNLPDPKRFPWQSNP